MKIYVPNLENYQCVYIRGEGIIRAYYQKPTYNSTVNYRDYYINSNYIFTDGQQNFSNYGNLPVCLASTELTDNFYYRNDLDSILIIFLILAIFIVFIPYKIFSRFFGRWLKL